LQRDIEVETTELRFGPTDQQTTFLGHIYFNGRNVAEELIEQGLARVVSSLPPVAKKGKKSKFMVIKMKPKQFLKIFDY